MSRPYREAVTATEHADGTVTAKLHGFGLTATGSNFAEALQKVGMFIDRGSEARKEFMRLWNEGEEARAGDGA